LFDNMKLENSDVIIFNLNKLKILEKEGLRINLHHIPERDLWNVSIIRRYLPMLVGKQSAYRLNFS